MHGLPQSSQIGSFNPRPPPKRGATRGLLKIVYQAKQVSIHAPLRREERRSVAMPSP